MGGAFGPWKPVKTMLRSARTKGDSESVVPQMTSAPIAAREVADALVALATGAPQGYAAEIGGPRTEEMPDMVRRLLRQRGSRRPVIGARLPGKAGTAMRSGALVPASPGTTGTQTYDAWLAEQAAQAGHA